MPKAVLDSTILVSAFLSKKGVAGELLRQAEAGSFLPCVSEEIVQETEGVLLKHPKARKQYGYTDQDVSDYVVRLKIVCQVIAVTLRLQGVVRDPSDDMIVACAVEAKAQHIITRDKDLLDLGSYEKIEMVSPEKYMEVLRQDS